MYICSSTMESCWHFLRMFHRFEGQFGVDAAMKTHSCTQQMNEQGDEGAGLSETAQSSPSQTTEHFLPAAVLPYVFANWLLQGETGAQENNAHFVCPWWKH